MHFVPWQNLNVGVFLDVAFNDIFETVHDGNLCQALHINFGFSDLDPFSRSQESLKPMKTVITTIFPF